MQCKFCGQRQHRKCYGYLDNDALLDTHICYTCLLIAEPSLCVEMKNLCLLRQVIWIIATEGYPLAERNIVHRLGEKSRPILYSQYFDTISGDCYVKDIKAISERLLSEKYLRKIHGISKKKAKKCEKRPQLPPYEFTTEGKARLYREYFNPTFKIENYVCY